MPATPAPKRPDDRSRRRLLGAAAAIVVAAGVGLGVVLPLGTGGPGGARAFTAPPVDPPRTAPATAGQGASGEDIRLPAGDGRPAVVTFLFTECPDVCPLIATRLRGALEELGPDADRIDVVAITVDPEDDTPRAVRRFLARYGLAGRMEYLVGTRPELRPVWAAWGVTPQPADDGGHGAGHREASAHSAPVILVDRSGWQVGKYSPGIPFSAGDLADDMRRLL